MMDSHRKLNTPKQTSVPTVSRDNPSSYACASATHPSVCSRSRDYLETIFKKINSGENVLSRIPTRLDPNIEFSDDDDDEDDTPSVRQRSPEKGQISTCEEKENKAKDVALVKSTDVFSRPRTFINKFPSQDKMCRENYLSRFHSASTSDKVKHLKTASVTRGPFGSTKKPILKPVCRPAANAYTPASSNLNGIQNGVENKIACEPPSDIIQVNNKNYNVLSLIGSGGSCKVYSVIDLQNKSRVAIKRVNLKDADPLIKNGYMQEIEYLQKLQNSDRVIKMYDFECQENELLLVLEHGDIDFAKYISNEAKLKRLTPLMIKFFWAQMLEAVGDIHKYGIVHSDLKPANFLLVAGNLKLIDFGIATSVPDDKTSTFRDTQVGTLNYMSPEAITQMSGDNKHPLFKVGVKSDVWSLGCILYNLVYGFTPFHNIKILMQKIYAITNPNYEISFEPISDPLLLDVLKLCLKRNPKERASIEELLQHPYLSRDNISSANSSSLKGNKEFDNVLAQMQNLTPRRMKHISKVVQELAKMAN